MDGSSKAIARTWSMAVPQLPTTLALVCGQIIDSTAWCDGWAAPGIVLGLDHQHLGRLVAVDADASALPGVDQDLGAAPAVPEA